MIQTLSKIGHFFSMRNSPTLQNVPGKPASVLNFGFPIAVFLLLALPSTSYSRDAFTIVVLVYLLKDFNHFKAGTSKLFRTPTILAGTTLILYVTLSTLWSQPPHIHPPGDQVRNGITVFLFWIGSCLYFYQDQNALKRLFWVIGIGLAGNIFGAWITGKNLFPYDRLNGYGILRHPNFISSVAVIHIAIGLNLKFRNLFENIVAIVMLIGTGAIVALSVSRGPILALLAVLIIWMASTPRIKTSHKAMIAIAATAAAAILAYSTNLYETLMERGTSNRPIIWQETITYSEQYLMLGWGWLNDFSQSVGRHDLSEYTGELILHPHGLLVSTLYYGGIVGLLLQIAFFYYSAKDATKLKCSLNFSLLAAILLLTATDTHTTITKRDFVLLIFWLPTAIIIMSSRFEKPGSDKRTLHQTH